MNRLNLLLAASLVAATAAAHADTVINLNATIPGYQIGGITNTLAPSFYQTLNLSAGTYTVSVIGAGYTATDGTVSVYSGWNQAENTATLAPAPNTWEERTGFNLNTQPGTFSSGNGQNVYSYPSTDQQLFLTGNGNCNVAGNCYTSAANALAAFSATPYTFTLASAEAITFYIPDQSYPIFPGFSDNTGGVSLDLKVAPTPEPSSLILLGTGVLGAAGVVRRRFSK